MAILAQGGIRRPQEPRNSGRPLEAPGGPRRPQKASGGSRRPQESSGGPRRTEEASGGPRRPQESSGGPRRPQKALGGQEAPRGTGKGYRHKCSSFILKFTGGKGSRQKRFNLFFGNFDRGNGTTTGRVFGSRSLRSRGVTGRFSRDTVRRRQWRSCACCVHQLG